jgi:hypothetical protein
LRLRQHGHMAALHLDGRGAYALGEEAFQVGMDSAILGGNDGPARLRLPCGAFNLLVEQVRVGGEVGGLDNLLLLLRRPSATSMWPKIGVGYLLSWLCTVSPASGATAAM